MRKDAFEELEACQQWWGGPRREGRVENDRAWRVPIGDIEADGRFDLDRKNPSRANDLAHRPPAELVAELLETERRIAVLLRDVDKAVAGRRCVGIVAPTVPLARFLRPITDEVKVDGMSEYPNVGVYSFGRGLFEKPPIEGSSTSARSLFRIRAGQFLYSRLFAFEGAYALVPPAFDGYFVSNEFPTFEVDYAQIDARYLLGYFQSPQTWVALAGSSKGLGVRRQRVQPAALLRHEIPFPDVPEQRRLGGIFEVAANLQDSWRSSEPLLAALRWSILNHAFADLSV